MVMINWNKDKPKINLVIDFIMMILLAMIAGLGFLIKYILVAGFERNVIYGSDVELYFWGLDRHQWGSIHLYLSFAFLFLILLHIVLHWKMIICIFGQMCHKKNTQVVIAVCSGIVVLFFALAPLFVKPEINSLERKHTHRQNIGQFTEHIKTQKTIEPSVSSSADFPVITEPQISGEPPVNQQKNHDEHLHSEMEIFGSMTLNEVSRKYSIPVSDLTNALKIPSNQSGEKIGRLKKKYGFEMDKLKNAVTEIGKSN
jgi:hypothetical protein